MILFLERKRIKKNFRSAPNPLLSLTFRPVTAACLSEESSIPPPGGQSQPLPPGGFLP